MTIQARDYLLWAKLGEGEYPVDSHPVACHLMDVCAVAEEMWASGVGPGFRRWIAEGIGLTESEAGRWIPFWIALHDIGKVSPAFQRKSHRAIEMLSAVGFNFGRTPSKEEPHGVISTVVLPSIWHEFYGIPERLGRKLSDAIGGHHGLFADTGVLGRCKANEQQLGDAQWDAARLAIVEMLGTAVGLTRRQELLADSNVSTAWLMTIAGMTTVADWIGSMTAFFPPAGDQVDWTQYIDRARAQAKSAMTSLGWNGWQPPSESWPLSELFPFIPKGSERPLQVAVTSLKERLSEPSLVLIEAPMGEGKTEAAMLLADHWAARCQQRGCYFALPTMATSNQMFGRIRDFLARRYPVDRVNLLLLHGRASLSEALRELIRNAQDLQTSSIGDERRESPLGIRQNLSASEWFTYRKRGLLAPFGVGTIDQTLLAVLQTKHVFVRLFGLAHKTIIIDEVHAYDAYMTSLLELLLTWLRSLGASVVLLSATLPASRRRQLLTAWQRGSNDWNPADVDNQEVSANEPQYPRISWIENNEVRAAHIAVTSKPPLNLVWKSANIAQLGNDLHEALRDGGCAAVICNTVTKAQSVYLELKNYFKFDELDLFHARYPFEEREEREKRTLGRFGKTDSSGNDSTGVIRARRVLVATQVIEQSLDIDFDLMVTEICPVDLLLQRAGRLHRHPRVRPAVLSLPILWVLKPGNEDATALDQAAPPDWEGSGFVYEKHILWRSWLALRGLDQIQIPVDIEPLIELVYDDRPCPNDLPDEWKRAWNSTLDELSQRRACDEMEAQRRLIKPPAYAGALSTLTQSSLDEDEENLHPSLRAVTRLGPRSVSVVCLYESAQGDRLAPNGPVITITPDPISGRLHHDDVEKLMRRSVSLSNRKVVNELLARSRVPKAWQKTPLLCNQHLLKFDAEGRITDPDLSVVLHQQLGVIFLSAERNESLD